METLNFCFIFGATFGYVGLIRLVDEECIGYVLHSKFIYQEILVTV